MENRRKKYISDNIKKLMRQGKSRHEAVYMSYNKWNREKSLPKYQEGIEYRKRELEPGIFDKFLHRVSLKRLPDALQRDLNQMPWGIGERVERWLEQNRQNPYGAGAPNFAVPYIQQPYKGIRGNEVSQPLNQIEEFKPVRWNIDFTRPFPEDMRVGPIYGPFNKTFEETETRETEIAEEEEAQIEEIEPVIEGEVPITGEVSPEVEVRGEILDPDYLYNRFRTDFDLGPDAGNIQGIDLTKSKEENEENEESVNRSYFNPYAGVDIPTAAFTLGQSIQDKNVLGTVGSGLKLGTGIARNLVSGMGLQRRRSEAEKEQRRNQRWSVTGLDRRTRLQEGGYIPPAPPISREEDQSSKRIPVEQQMTGEYLQGASSQNHAVQPNAEVEAGEYILSQDGQYAEVVGNKHSQGGEEVELQEGDMVISDHTKIGGKNAKIFRDRFGIKARAKNTYADIVDRVKRKIGVSKLIEEEESINKKIKEQQENTKDEATKNLNLQYLYSSRGKLIDEKRELEPQVEEAMRFIFQQQEAEKKEEKEENVLQEGGTVKDLAQKHGLSPEEAQQAIREFNTGKGDDKIGKMATERGITRNQAERLLSKYREIDTYAKEHNISYDQAKILMDTVDVSGIIPAEFKEVHNLTNNEAKEILRIFEQGGMFESSGEFLKNFSERRKLSPHQAQAIIEQMKPKRDPNIQAFAESNNITYNQAIDVINNTDPHQDLIDDLAYKHGLSPEEANEALEVFKAGGRIEDEIDKLQNWDIEDLVDEGIWDLTEQHISLLEERFPDLYEKYVEDGQISDTEDLYKELGDNRKNFLQEGFNKAWRQVEGVKPISNPSLYDLFGHIELPEITGPTLRPFETEEEEEEEQDNLTKTEYDIALMPDMYVTPPSAVQPHLKANRRYDRVSPTLISPEQQIQQNQATFEAARRTFDSLPPAQRSAAIAQLTASMNEANAQAIAQAEQYNTQIMNQADMQNARIQMREEDAAVQDAMDYEKRQYTAQALTDEQIRRYNQYRNQVNLNNYNNIRNLNTINQILENFGVEDTGTFNLREADPAILSDYLRYTYQNPVTQTTKKKKE